MSSSIRDHRSTQHRSQPQVRDHRTQPQVRDHRSQPDVRDHRSQPQVRDHRSQPDVRDHRSQPDVRDHRTQPDVRDHRSQPDVRDQWAQPVIRDHRSQPTVRDHRSSPVVRDHRANPIAGTPRLEGIDLAALARLLQSFALPGVPALSGLLGAPSFQPSGSTASFPGVPSFSDRMPQLGQLGNTPTFSALEQALLSRIQDPQQRALMQQQAQSGVPFAGIPSGDTTFDLANQIANAPTFSPTEQALLSKIKDPEQRAIQELQMQMQKQALLCSVVTNLANMRHEMKKGVAQNFRG